MNIAPSERRLIENEMIFRRANEKVGVELAKINAQHKKEKDPELVRTDDIVLHFKCECSDENCNERIPIKLSVYKKIHKNRAAFIIKPEHQVKAIEKLVRTTKSYSIVVKNHTVPEPSGGLNSTSVNNS